MSRAAASAEAIRLGPADIERYLPHRPPMRLLDAVTQLVPDERAEGFKRLDAADRVFDGHFPNEPILPGVLIVEACAQLGALALAAAAEPDPRAEAGRPTGYLAAIHQFKFTSPVTPGDTLTLTAVVGKRMGHLVDIGCSAKVGRRPIAQGRVSVALAAKTTVMP